MPLPVDATLIENFAEIGLLIQITKPFSNTTKRAKSSSGSEPWSRDFFWILVLFNNENCTKLLSTVDQSTLHCLQELEEITLK